MSRTGFEYFTKYPVVQNLSKRVSEMYMIYSSAQPCLADYGIETMVKKYSAIPVGPEGYVVHVDTILMQNVDTYSAVLSALNAVHVVNGAFITTSFGKEGKLSGASLGLALTLALLRDPKLNNVCCTGFITSFSNSDNDTIMPIDYVVHKIMACQKNGRLLMIPKANVEQDPELKRRYFNGDIYTFANYMRRQMPAVSDYMAIAVDNVAEAILIGHILR